MKKISLFLIAVIILTGLCGCGDKANTESYFSGEANAENYFGGEGQLKYKDGILYDQDNFYFISHYYHTLEKFNKKTEALSVACLTPGCTHDIENVECKANLNEARYRFFNGNLIKIHNERIQNSDGTISHKGYLYLCGKSETQVFENVLPEEIDSKKYDPSIGIVNALGDDYLALYNGVYMYILDTDFKIKFTVFELGSYSGGVYYAYDEIYYIDNLYRLIKIDKETGEHSVVDLGSMKLTEGVVRDNVLWFSNEEYSLCSYDFKTGEVKEYAPKAVRMNCAGKFIKYMNFDEGGVNLYDVESGENRKCEDIDINFDELYYIDGNYYKYNYTRSELAQYDGDLSSVIKVYTLTD